MLDFVLNFKDYLRCFELAMRTLGQRTKKRLHPSTYNLAKKKLLESYFIRHAVFIAIASRYSFHI